MPSPIDPAYRRAFRAAGRLGACDPSESIVLAGSPRSGTTLLYEILADLSGHKALNEPLRYRDTRERHGFDLRTFLSPETDAPLQARFLDFILRGQVGSRGHWSFNGLPRPVRLVQHATRRRLVVKFCRANRMLQWMARRLPVRKIVLIVRHPCAVVSSMRRFGQWDKTFEEVREMKGSPVDLRPLPPAVRDRFEPIAERITTRIEQLALTWCLDHFLPLMHHDDHPWILAPYERLVRHRGDELRRIVSGLGHDPTPAMARRLDRPSSSVRTPVETSPGAQLSKWKEHLRPEEIDSILGVGEEAGLAPVYHGDLDPDYARLDALQVPGRRWAA